MTDAVPRRRIVTPDRVVGVVHENRKEYWHTPNIVLDAVRRVGPIVFDPASDRLSKVGAEWVCLPPENDESVPAELRGIPDGSKLAGYDGLSVPWYLCGGLTFCNHPYGRQKNARWARKSAIEWLRALEHGRVDLYQSIILTPATPSAHWWSTYWDIAPAIAFWSGRIPFEDPLASPSTVEVEETDGAGEDRKPGATFDSALIYFGRHLSAFAEAFEPECNRVLLFPETLAAQMRWAKERSTTT